jgi:hypothetical protein
LHSDIDVIIAHLSECSIRSHDNIELVAQRAAIQEEPHCLKIIEIRHVLNNRRPAVDR